MSVAVLTNDLEHFLNVVKIRYPDLKFDKNKPTDLKRLYRKLIRDRDPILKILSIILDIDMPLYLIYDLLRSDGWEELIISFKTEKLSFDHSLNLTTSEENQLTCLFKKVSSIFKENNMLDDWNKVRHFLPLSTIVKTTFTLNPIQTYKLISWFLMHGVNPSEDLYKELMISLSKNLSDIFNEQNLEVFMGVSKEK
jgi:hypothetical protein